MYNSAGSRRPTRAVIRDVTADGRAYLTVGIDRPARAPDVAAVLIAAAEALQPRPDTTVLHLAFDTVDHLAAPSVSLTVYYERAAGDGRTVRG